ncbi:MAG: PBP1A family penicillin-binding protein [Alphaproteobacteria bacterium]|nr:PBP1A family penicillin-binding protein [Alphaproteobacteria bacterium]
MEKLKLYMKKLAWFSLRALFWLLLTGIVALTLIVLRYGADLPDYRGLATYAPPVATRLYASDGSLLIEYAEERRVFIDYTDMPKQLVNAFIAAEDKNFWHHPGIDVFGIVRAGANNVIHFAGGGARFTGASTITQQVAKNFFLTSDRTMSRKIREGILALKLERAFSKEHIMTLYLNQIFLGARAYGVGSASLMYFNKPVKELTLAESAFLASLPKAPNDRAKATERRNYVLRRMMEEGFITKEEMTAAQAEQLNINSGFMAQQSDDFQYFAEEVRRELLDKIGREELYNGGLYIKTTIDPDFQRAAVKALKTSLDAYNAGRGGSEKLQGAVIAINPHTGRVLAMAGGYSFAQSSFNRSTQAYRQIGSTIKPFVYLAALEDSDVWNPTSLILDAPIVGWKEDDSLWKPENYDKKFLGPVPLRLALEQSRNVPTVRLVEQIGVRKAVAAAQRFGVYPENLKNMNLSLALGSGETTLQKLTLGFAAFINGGYRQEPKLVDYIEDRYGRLVGTGSVRPEDWRNDLTPPQQKENGEPLADPQSLYQVVSILQGVVERGTGRAAHVPGHTIAGKTGTTNDVKDVWFVGFSKDLVAGVWMGYDTPKPMGAGAGSHMAAKVFSDFMTVALASTKDQPFPVPNGIEFRRINRQTGTPATGSDGFIINEAFKRGQKPNQPGINSPQPTSDGYQQPVEVGGVF